MARRESIGKTLKSARLAMGLSVPELQEKIKREHRYELSVSVIRDIESERSPNPGFKTVAFIALGLGLNPLEVINLGLNDPAETDPGYHESYFVYLHRLYRKVQEDRRPFADELLKMVGEKLERWR
jgi:transcriptional regulator with XRE-family HTH domain